MNKKKKWIASFNVVNQTQILPLFVINIDTCVWRSGSHERFLVYDKYWNIDRGEGGPNRGAIPLV